MRKYKYVFIALAIVAAVCLSAGINPGKVQAGNASPWIGIKNVENMDIWRKGKQTDISLSVSPPSGIKSAQLDVKLYALADNGTETHALDIHSADIANATEYTVPATLPQSLASGIYMLRCSYKPNLDIAPAVTANAVIVLLDEGQQYGWQGGVYYDIDGPLQDGIYSILNSDLTSSYYFFEGGQVAYGLRQSSGYSYMFNESGLTTGWQKSGNNWMYFSEGSSNYGEMSKGWVQDKDDWYYMGSDGIMKKGWVKTGVPASWYFLKPGGAMATGWHKDNGKWYYLGDNGKMATGWLKLDGRWYYLGADGAMATGWQKIGGKWYYFNPNNGAMMSNTTIGNYQLGADGVML